MPKLIAVARRRMLASIVASDTPNILDACGQTNSPTAIIVEWAGTLSIPNARITPTAGSSDCGVEFNLVKIVAKAWTGKILYSRRDGAALGKKARKCFKGVRRRWAATTTVLQKSA
jgi:hypothetical protein